LFDCLKRAGLAKEQVEEITLNGCAITNAVACVPPQNRPNGAEASNCRPFLSAKLEPSVHELRIIPFRTLRSRRSARSRSSPAIIRRATTFRRNGSTPTCSTQPLQSAPPLAGLDSSRRCEPILDRFEQRPARRRFFGQA